jgi:Beta-galactosidase/beta-glucuronidase
VVVDQYETPLGIRYFNFDVDKGFSLNGVSMKINGVCEHHDLGALGTAFNVHALERQFKILKEMGVNAIRTSHNPPAPEFLDLADRMGFIIMDEAFDVWQVGKRPRI